MASWSRRQRALVTGLLVALTLLATVTIALWPDGDATVAVGGDVTITTSTTAPVEPTTTTVEPTTTTMTTTAVPTTTAPTTTEASTTTAQPTATPPQPTATTMTTSPPPPYRSSIENVTAAQLGSSYTPASGCVPPDALRAVDLTHWGYDGTVHQGRLIIASAEAERVAAIFGDLYAARFPIERVEPVDRYGADDEASMRANNTSGYNCRTIAGTTTLSNHAFGRAIDVNPLHNPYVRGEAVDPPEGAPWADRSNRRPGMIFGGDAVVAAFAARGWGWGGSWTSPDFQHFDKR